VKNFLHRWIPEKGIAVLAKVIRAAGSMKKEERLLLDRLHQRFVKLS